VTVYWQAPRPRRSSTKQPVRSVQMTASMPNQERSVTACLEMCVHSSVLEIEGTLRTPVNTGLRKRVAALLGRGERRIVLDLARLSDIDAAGIGELLRAYQATTAAGGELHIANASKRVRELLEIAGVLTLLTSAGAQLNTS